MRAYGPRSLKRRRRSNAEIDRLREALFDIVEAQQPMTVRQIFYQATVADLVAKEEAQYHALGRLLTQMRRDGTIPYEWIADNTRWMRRPSTYTGLADFIEQHQRDYRRDLWAEAPDYIEVWCEKEALAGVIYEETWDYDVPLGVSRGFASESYLYTAADVITTRLSDQGSAWQAVIYYFGDFDPSGLKIGESIERGLRRICRAIVPDWWDEDMLVFERVAVTPAQVEQWDLPTRPTKRAGNAHAKDFAGDSVELDAIPPLELRGLVRACIERHVNRRALEVLRVAEESERDILRAFGKQVASG
jgi:hypothetical protein